MAKRIERRNAPCWRSRFKGLLHWSNRKLALRKPTIPIFLLKANIFWSRAARGCRRKPAGKAFVPMERE